VQINLFDLALARAKIHTEHFCTRMPASRMARRDAGFSV
jgi:hypothetical protein